MSFQRYSRYYIFTSLLALSCQSQAEDWSALAGTPNENGHASVLATFVLPPTNITVINPNIALGSLELAAKNGYPNSTIPGIGSALVPIPNKPGEFYMMTDRGVNFDYVNSAGKVYGLSLIHI